MFNRRKPDDPQPPPKAPDVAPQANFLESEPAHKAVDVPEDNGLDVPPRPIFTPLPNTQKETPMARSPFAPALPQTPGVPVRPAAMSTPGNTPAPTRDNAERRTLVVGRGISVQGTVQDAERLVVEGTMEATMINGLVELSIAHGGVFKGEVEVDEAEVAGTIDGTLTARNALIVRSSGRVLGVAKCRRLQVEDGGQITGRIEMLSEAHAPAAPAPSSPVPQDA